MNAIWRWWLLLSSCALTLASWGISSSIASSPDEDYHLASIWCAQGERLNLCEQSDSDPAAVWIPEALANAKDCFLGDPANSARCEEAYTQELVETTRVDHHSYPPVFYLAMSLFVSKDTVLSVLTMRIVNSLIYLGMISALVVLARGRRQQVVLVALGTLLPLGMFIVPSVNPSSWAFTSATVLFASVLAFFKEHEKKHKIKLLILASFAAILGAGARTDAAVYSVFAIVLAGIFSWKDIKAASKSLLIPFAALVILAAGFFFASGHSAAILSIVPTRADDLVNLITNLEKAPELWAGTMGTWGLGWLDTIMPGSVWFYAIAVFCVLAFTGLQASARGKWLAASLTFLALLMVPTYLLTRNGYTVGDFVQPRYIAPLLVILLSVLLYRESGEYSFSRAQLISLAAALSVANSVALYTNIRRYVTGTDVKALSLDENVEWWWNFGFSPMAVWITGTLAFGVVLALLVRIQLQRNLVLDLED